MPGFITALGQQLATDAAGKALGIAFSPIENAIQYKQQEKLQGLQIKGSKELTDYNTAKQMEMWRNTNYSSQRAEMIKAGLNPALMYGMGILRAGTLYEDDQSTLRGTVKRRPVDNLPSGEQADNSKRQKTIQEVQVSPNVS